MSLGRQGVANLARALSQERGVDIQFAGSWPVTDGARVRVPLFEGDDEFMIGSVDAMTAVAALGDKAYLELAAHNALLSQLYCAIESARCMQEFAKQFEGAPSHAKLANGRWQALIAMGELDEISIAVASVGLEAHGSPSKSRACQELRAMFPELYDRLARVGDAGAAFELAFAFNEAFAELEGADELASECAFSSPGDEDGDGDEDEDEEDEDGEGGDSEGPFSGKGAPGGKLSAKDMKERMERVASDAGLSEEQKAEIKKQIEAMLAAQERSESEGGNAGPAGGHKWPWAIPISEGGAAKLIPMFTDHDETREHDGEGDREEESRIAREVAPAVRAMVAGFERVLKTREQIKWRFERERGDIDTRSLAKLQASPGFRAPFKDKKVFESDAVAVQVLVDLSGSMHGDNKIAMACQAAMALAMAMKRLDIDCEVSGFSSGDCAEYQNRKPTKATHGRRRERLVMRKFKSFGKQSLRGLTLIDIDGSAVQNPDGEAVSWAADQLMANPRKRKILLVLSDGEPGTGESPCHLLALDLKSRLAAIKKAGIETIGLGIMTSDVEQFYEERAVVNNLNDLASVALDKLCSILLRGQAKR